MFLAVPYVGILKLICSRLPELKPVGYLLGTSGTDEHALTWQKVKKFLGFKKAESAK
jgi:hypothetical protein